MAINKNHEFEELDGVKCAIVEKNASPERVAFLKNLLEQNRYTVVVVASPPPKAAPAPKPVEGEAAPAPVEAPPPPSTFTVGVTDVTFNPTNAIFGRLLKTKNGKVVTLAYWKQEEESNDDTIPYFAEDEIISKWK
ncbi:hypothetical protein IQ13_1866 [Lacibacter cauensis]|uniref:Uncharacterized protein n=1 Tax=Lacibacter cauensis TaxID=510947 RepID=A0A562SRB3_9BACT|nr:hypothetical protein [Lacibacter cauensis]TWI83752.1 hypothetical protein IQ13_1866 [Lacibacter cauensis]